MLARIIVIATCLVFDFHMGQIEGIDSQLQYKGVLIICICLYLMLCYLGFELNKSVSLL